MSELKIGSLTLKNQVILAPMAGVSDLPFRNICAEMGAGMVCMEMVSAKALSYKNKNTYKLLEISENEHPVSLQLFGSEPELIGEVVEELNDYHFDVIDFNMGCPVPKVVNNNEGSALMKNPALAGRIMEELVKHSKKPVTIKIRKGFDSEHVNAYEIAHIAQESGVSAVAIHGRTRSQYYSGNADWDIIAEVKSKVSIPVLGNGDITSPQRALDMLNQTKCDGILIGRAAQGNPWIFRDTVHFLETGEILGVPSTEERKKVSKKHADLMLSNKGEYIAVREMRKHLAWYTQGMPGASHYRSQLNTLETMDDIYRSIEEVFGEEV